MCKKPFVFFLLLALLFGPGISEARPLTELKGRILLQVDEAGEAWYVNPEDNLRYFLGRPDDAFRIMRQQGMGISNRDIARIQPSLEYLSGKDSDGDGLPDDFERAMGTDPYNPDTSGNGYTDKTEIKHGYDPLQKQGKLPLDEDFARGQAGKILLQVENNGEAWYVSPENHKRYFLGRPQDAFQIMRFLGLGISNKDLDLIAKGDKEKESQGAGELSFEMELGLDKEVYQERDDLDLSIRIFSNQELDDLKIEAKGISNNFGYYYFTETENLNVSKGEAETVDMHTKIPSCSACTGISPGFHSIKVLVYHEEEKLGEEEVDFEIR